MLNQTLPKDLDLVLKLDTSELRINIILINTDRFINLDQYLTNRTIEFYYTPKQLTNIGSGLFITNLIPEKSTLNLKN
jgi:hypothetical protein